MKMLSLKKYLSEELQINLSSEQEKQFQEYSDFLQEYNSHTNLTRIAPEDIELLHFYDSLSAAKFVDFSKFKNLIDVGTGAGFPGVPLKIIYPHLKVTLVDSRNKKVKFLNELLERLNIDGAEAIHARAEDLKKNVRYRNAFDIVTARAVAELKDLVKLLSPLMNKHGRMLVFKGPKAGIELKAADKIFSQSKIELLDSLKFNLPESNEERVLLLLGNS